MVKVSYNIAQYLVLRTDENYDRPFTWTPSESFA